MKGLAWLGGLALATAASAAFAQASAPAPVVPTWTLDPTHTFVHWEVVHMGTSTIRGRFGKAAGNLQFDAKAQQLDVSISIDTASVSSGVPILDALLKGSAMLDVAANPQAFFVARNAKFDGDPIGHPTAWHQLFDPFLLQQQRPHRRHHGQLA